MPGIAVLLLLAACVTGVVMLWYGLRGRGINDHPVCRWCRFDLDGVYPESVTCPECGAGLKRQGAVRVGVRRRMPTFIAAGILLATLPLAPMGMVAWALVTGANIDSYKPLGLLLWESRVSDPARLDALAAELAARAMAGKLDPGQYRRMVDQTLAMQGNTRRPWRESWGDLIERARLDGVLTAEQEARFRSQAAVLEIETRSTARAGAYVPVRIRLKEARVGSGMRMACSVVVNGARVAGKQARWERPASGPVSVLGEPILAGEEAATFMLTGSRAAGLGGMFFVNQQPSRGEVTVLVPADCSPGDTTLELELQRAVTDASGGGVLAMINGRLRATGRSSVRTPVEVTSAPVRIVAAENQAATAIPATKPMSAHLAQALRPSRVTLGSDLVSDLFFGADPFATAGQASASFMVNGVSVPVAFEVWCRAGGREWKLGELHSGSRPDADGDPFGAQRIFRSMTTITLNGRTITRSSSSGDDADGRRVAGPWEGGDAVEVDLILRPVSAIAERTIELESYYAGEIVIAGVPVERQGALLDPFADMRSRIEGRGRASPSGRTEPLSDPSRREPERDTRPGPGP
nr:hypothetical protein [Phycisphaerales bacterium]